MINMMYIFINLVKFRFFFYESINYIFFNNIFVKYLILFKVFSMQNKNVEEKLKERDKDV